MTTSQIKREIIAAAIGKQTDLIGDFKRRIDDLLANDGNVNEEEYDNHQQSFKSESMAEVNLLSKQLDFANKELEELNRLEAYETHAHDTVEYGTIVKTDKQNFFVSASVEQLHVGGMQVFGISINAPIYATMKGKRKGDTFRFNDVQYKILEIF